MEAAQMRPLPIRRPWFLATLIALAAQLVLVTAAAANTTGGGFPGI